MQQPGFLDENATRGGAHLEGQLFVVSLHLSVKKKKKSHQQLQPDIPALGEEWGGRGETAPVFPAFPFPSLCRC